MKFCSECAHPVVFEIPPDDNLPRYICRRCKTIHYQNPKIVVCTLPFWQKDGEISVLLCRRAIEPREGFWTLPGGFMENNETTKEAAKRETEEEAGADIAMQDLFALMSLPTVQQVHLFYLAKLKSLSFAPGLETLEIQMFSQKNVPWHEIAFASTYHALELFFANPEKAVRGEYKPHSLDLKQLVTPT